MSHLFPPSSRSFLIGAAITLLWLGMMYTLVRDRVLPQRRAAAVAARSVDPSSLTTAWEDIEEFMLVTFGDASVGATGMTVHRHEGAANFYDAKLSIVIRPQIAGIHQTVAISAVAELDTAFVLRRYHISLDLGGFDLAMTGQSDDEVLLVETRQGGETRRAKYALPGPISLMEAVRPAATRSLKIEPGQTLAIPVADPVMSMQVGVLEIRVVKRDDIQVRGRTREAFLVESNLGDFVSTSWVAPDGTTLRRQLAGGFMLDSVTSDVARAASPDVMRETVRIPVLSAADFEGIAAEPIDRLTQRRDSPLAILGAFTR